MIGKELVELIQYLNADNYDMKVEIISNGRVYTYILNACKSNSTYKDITLLGTKID